MSGTSQTGAFYQYYQCASNRRKGGCGKKAVRKKYIEDKVIYKTIGFLTPANIDMLARSIEDRCEQERNTEDLKRITKLIRENEKATANLVKALETGKAADIISAQIEKRQQEKADLEAQLAMEKIQRPVLKYEQLKYFFERFAKGDPDDIRYRQALVDIFIGRIELYDDHMIIYYNAHDGQKTSVPVDELEKVRLRGAVVEAGRVELPSESALTVVSPGAGGYFRLPRFPDFTSQAATRRVRVAS